MFFRASGKIANFAYIQKIDLYVQLYFTAEVNNWPTFYTISFNGCIF